MALQAVLDGVDVSDVVQEATSDHNLNEKYVATAKIPVAQAFELSDGARLKLVDADLPGNDIDHHGTVKFESAEDGEDGDGLVEYTSESAREIWEWRLARDGPSDTDDPGNYVTPDFLTRLEKGPLVMEDVLLQSDDGSDPALGEGDMAMTFGSFPADGIDLSGAPASFPLSIDALARLLCSTGELDVVETMIDSAGAMSQIDCFNGNYGDDLTGSIEYVYEGGLTGNVRTIKRTRDMAKLANKLRYLLGPRKTDERWGRSIEATNVDIPDTSTYTQADLVSAIMASRAAWLVRFDLRTYDTFSNESNAIPLYWRLWQDESLWRLQPRTLYRLTPTEGELPAFDVGDLVGVGAFAEFMGGFSGAQRVFGRKITWDVDGVASLGELRTSADSEILGA
jgi:hypothetical protein